MADVSQARRHEEGLCARIDELLLMEHVLVESYRSAADRIEGFGLRGTVGDFMRAHEDYIDALEDLSWVHGRQPADPEEVRRAMSGKELLVARVSDDRALVEVLSELERRAAAIAERALSDPRISADPDLTRLLRNAAIDYEHHADWLTLAQERM